MISASTVIPSPSATTARASSRAHLRERLANEASVAAVRSSPLAPFASSSTQSFVDGSPSTEIALKDVSTAGRR